MLIYSQLYKKKYNINRTKYGIKTFLLSIKRMNWV